MTVPTKTLQHKSNLYLIFSPKCIPWAEVAQFYLSCPNHDNLHLGVDFNLLLKEPTLIVPKGKAFIYAGAYSDSKQTLRGKSSILRYFARLNQSNICLKANSLIEEFLDKIRTAQVSDNKILDLINPKSEFLVGEKISIADLIAWDYTIKSKADSNWFRNISKVSELQKAHDVLSKVLNTIPVLHKYKFIVVEQVAQIFSIDAELVASVMTDSKSKDHGDLVIPIPALKVPGNPVELAKTLVSKFKTGKDVVKVTSNGPFAQFYFNTSELLADGITQAITMGDKFGSNYSGLGKLAICEFSSPNIAKPFHIGHLRSTIIGSFLQKLLSLSGWQTVSINYLGDWGKQYGLLAVGYEKFGSEKALLEDPIKHLYEVYVKINAEASENEAIHDEARAYFKKMEDGNSEALALWQRFRDLSIVKYQETYARLNIVFDVYSGESQYSLSQMKNVLDELTNKNLIQTDGGALIVDLKEHSLGTAVIGKSDGSMLYLSRDIAAAQDRYDCYDFDKMFYCVASQQDHHFRQLFKILELSGKPWVSKCEHISFGLIKSKDGNMSTRKGTVVFLADILDNVKEEMHAVMKKNEDKYKQVENPEYVSDVVGMSAIKIQDMAAKRIKDYAFDWARMLSFEGDTGPYLQYAHARMCSIERLSEYKLNEQTIKNVDLSVLVEPQALALMEQVCAFPDVIRELSVSLEPCGLVKYALRLSHAVSSAITVLYVTGQPAEIAKPRLAMYVSARICLGNSLRMLGLEPLQRM